MDEYLFKADVQMNKERNKGTDKQTSAWTNEQMERTNG